MGIFRHKWSAAHEERERQEQQKLNKQLNARLGIVKPNEEIETSYNTNLMIVGAQLTQICHPDGGKPKEIVATYAEVMDELRNWFEIVPMREKLENMLEETVWSRWSVKEQPVVPIYTPRLNRRQGLGGNHQAGL